MPILIDVCSFIGSGLVVNRYIDKKNHNDNNLTPVFTIKSIKNFCQVDSSLFDRVTPIREIPKKYLAQKGDIIIRNSSPYDATCLDEDKVLGTIIPSGFTIIRVGENDIDPNYLALYLNSEIVKEYFDRETLQSSMKIIKASALKTLQIKTIPIEKQHNLIELSKLLNEEMSILEEILQQKRNLSKILISNKLEEN